MDTIKIVERSYGQCCTSRNFFDDFYKNFIGSSPEVAQRFEHTDLSRQKQLLRSGIAHLIMCYKGQPLSKMKAEKLGKSHSRDQLNIRPELYELWLGSLLKTIKQHDPEYDNRVRAAWEEVMKSGIRIMTAFY